MSNLKNTGQFINDLFAAFPEIESEVLDEDYVGFVSLQIGCFRRFTQNAINNGDLDTVKKCIEFDDANFDTTVFEVENSLFISYAGKLDFSRNPDAEEFLTAKIVDARNILVDYYNSAPKSEKLAKFLNDLEPGEL